MPKVSHGLNGATQAHALGRVLPSQAKLWLSAFSGSKSLFMIFVT
jgi:hypothetical protein